MRILITGASGMVGQHLVRQEGLTEHVLLTPSSRELNLLDAAAVERYIAEQHPDLILHAAGKVGGIRANMADPVHFFLDNLDMGRNLVWAARKNGVKRLLNLGSSCMYPRHAPNPLREEYVLQGELEPTNEGYALAKIATARLCDYIRQADARFQYKTLIPCNLYGPWDKFDPEHSHMIPAVIRKIHQAKQNGSAEVEIWGDGTARREFMYVGDLAELVAMTIRRFDECPPYLNVGLGFDFSVNEYYQAVADVIGYTGTFVHDLTKPTGMQQKVVDVTRLREFGWTAGTDLQTGIRKTYDFYLQQEGK